MFYASDLMAKHGIKALFSDREGGCSVSPFDSLNLGSDLGDSEENVIKNLNHLCVSAGLNLPHQSKQVHGIQVCRCQGSGKLHQDADILITTQRHTTIAVRTADCLPILLVDKKTQVAAAVHAGWRGSVQRVVQVAVSEMCGLGANEENILASLGPCIAACCFEISADVGHQLSQSCGKNVVSKRRERLFADLGKTNMLQLLACGLQPNNIELSLACTACQVSPSYFSYRRDHGETGRQLSMISLP